MTLNVYDDLLQRWREAALLGSCAALLGWDERTMLPRNGSNHRAEQMALLARLIHERMTSPVIGERLAHLEGQPLADDQAANVREIRRQFRRATRLPVELVEELARVTTQSQQIWQEAKETNNFAAFCPWLEKIVALKRREADAVGFDSHPYDALLDEYEPGMTTAELTSLFADLSAELAPLVAQIAASPRRPETAIVLRDSPDFPIDSQQQFGRAVAVAVGFDFDAGRLDSTSHPFCCTIGPGDCRITTRYSQKHFNESFFGILHEAGHGIYEQNLPGDRYGTPLGSACSMGIHESQSRLWENQVGRSRPFWEHFYPKAQAAFPVLAGVSLDQFFFAVNDVRPSFNRVEADEATYNLHIILRFELEQALVTGDLQPADVPDAWNRRFEELLGLKVPDDKNGCLQDIHWSFGGLGYFPTYTLGNLYAAQFMAKAREDLPSLDDDFRRGEFARLKSWLTTNIHCHGQRYRAAELCRRLTGKAPDHRPLIAYLRAKYAELYGFN
jgi:carboxypeptidase Taq